MLTEIFRNNAHLARSRQIAEILARHGLDYILSILGLERFISFRRGLRLHHSSTATRPEHIRQAFEELGATFIKFGQILSTRADLLPLEYRTELAKLQDSALAVPSDQIRQVIEAEFGCGVEDLFVNFDDTPLAAASIGQAHAATLEDGTEVVVKIQRPDVSEQIEVDLEILETLALAAARRWEFANNYDVLGLAQEFAQTLRAELDYIFEARNAERFAANFKHDPTVHIPQVFWHRTTSRVLTLERIRGLKIEDSERFDEYGIDRGKLAENAARIILKMIFEHGFFHADPHAGNFFIEEDGKLGLIDFGMVGLLDERMKEQLADLLIAINSHDSERLVNVFLELGVAKGGIDRDGLERDIDHIISRYYGRPLGELRVGSLLSDAFAVIRDHHLHLPAGMALLLKTLVMSEGLGAQLDPKFHLTSVIVPYAEKLIIRQYSPKLWAKKLKQTSVDIARLVVDMPEHLRRIIGDLERGGLQIGVRPQEFEPIIQRMERLANRIVLGVIAAAFINGLAVLTSSYHPPGWDRLAGFAFAFGFLIAALLGIYLAWSILRSGR
jgi:ubiquinone biosynthesis protein